jgi:hypothetical protein
VSHPCRPPRSLEELTRIAGDAVGDAWPAVVTLTPPLPTQWPDTHASVVFFTYRIAEPPTRRITYRVHGPVHRITFATIDAAPVTDVLDATAVLGDITQTSGTEREDEAHLIEASRVLLEVAAGCRAVADARDDLVPYATWLRWHEPIARDLETRIPTFLAWLRQ